MRIVEEVTFDAPGFIVDLLPHRTGLDGDFPAIKFEWTEPGLGRRCPTCAGRTVIGRRGRPGIALAVENFLTIERDGEIVNLFDQFVDLALAQIELLNVFFVFGYVVL